MTIQRYELLDLTSDDGPRAMVTEYEEGTYVLHADHFAEVAALKARIAEPDVSALVEALERKLHDIASLVVSCGCGHVTAGLRDMAMAICAEQEPSHDNQ